MIRKAKLSKKQLQKIHAYHGHKSGNGLLLGSIHDKKTVHIENPTYIEHINGNKHTVIAQGMYKGKKVSQIVKHRG